MEEPEVVVFDVGGVLIDADYRVLCRKLLADDAEVEFFLTEVLGTSFHHERDLGAPMAETAAKWSARHPDYAVTIHAFCDRFPEMWLGPVPGTVEVLDELQAASVGVYGLTNWGRETWALARAQFPFLDRLDGVLVSSHVGLTKPDPAIFAAFCTTFDVAAGTCFFVDDVERNIEAARELGFHGAVFTDATTLRHDLAGYGLLRPRTG